jgi:hypothetical protein
MKKLNFRLLWAMFMILVFLGMFVLLVFTGYFSAMSIVLRIILGVVFLVYALFRGYQVSLEIRNSKKTKNSDSR